MAKIILSLPPKAAQMILSDPSAFIGFMAEVGISVTAVEATVDADEEPEREPDDSMDGDAASALASAGFGTDEDYEHGLWDEGYDDGYEP